MGATRGKRQTSGPEATGRHRVFWTEYLILFSSRQFWYTLWEAQRLTTNRNPVTATNPAPYSCMSCPKNLRLLAILVAATVLTNATRGQVSFLGTEISESNTSQNAKITFSANPASLSYDFSSTAGADTLAVTWQAPTGKQFQIYVPTGVTTAYLNLAISGGSMPGAFTDFSGSASANFSGGSIPAGAVTNFKLADNGTAFNIVYASGPLTPGNQYTFDSVTVTGTVASTFTSAFSSVPVASFYLEGTSTVGSGSFGQWVTTEVPEPTTWVWSGTMLGAGIMGLWRRRRVRS